MSDIKFHLKKSQKKEELHIILHCTFATNERNERLRYYTNISCKESNWAKSQVGKKDMSCGSKNDMLNLLESAAIDIRIRYALDKKILTKDIFKRELDVVRYNKNKNSNYCSFQSFFEKHIESKKANKQLATSTYKIYQTTLMWIQKYVTEKHVKFDYPDFNEAFFEKFVNYLFDNGRNANSTQKIAVTLKSVLRKADSEGESKILQFKETWLKVKKVDTDAIYLDEEDLKKIAEVDLSKKPDLDKLRDLFLFGCHTGLRYSDYSRVRAENIKNEGDIMTLNIITQKTNEDSKILLPEKAREILKKYNGDLPYASNQYLNRSLKEIGRLAGLDQQVALKKYEGQTAIKKIFKKYEKITTHTARRSFITNALNGGIPSTHIMYQTGHKTEKEFQKYNKLTANDKIKILADYPSMK